MQTIEQALLHIVVLVVDDNPEDQGALAAQLRSLGAKDILKASSGKEAFNLLKAPPRPVDLIVADVRMADGNGLQLLQGVRTGYVKTMRANGTFVLVTAFPEVGVIQTAAALDANGLIAKPVKPEKFEAALLKARRTVFPPNVSKHLQVFVPESF